MECITIIHEFHKRMAISIPRTAIRVLHHVVRLGPASVLSTLASHTGSLWPATMTSPALTSESTCETGCCVRWNFYSLHSPPLISRCEPYTKLERRLKQLSSGKRHSCPAISSSQRFATSRTKLHPRLDIIQAVISTGG